MCLTGATDNQEDLVGRHRSKIAHILWNSTSFVNLEYVQFETLLIITLHLLVEVSSVNVIN